MTEGPVTFQFPEAHATVIFTNELSAATKRRMPRLYVQIMDQYRYQREWVLELRHEPGDSKKLYWESHVYMHPGRRCIMRVGEAQAVACIRRFLRLCKEYPSLLFNREGEHETDKARPRCEGFVHFAEQLHRGEPPSKRML